MKKIRKFDPLGFREVWNDLVNYRDWIKTLDREKKNPKSLLNKYSLDYDFFRNLFVILTLPGEDLPLPDNIKRLRVTESLRPVNQYLDEDLNFSEFLIPEFNQVYQDDEPTLSYMIIYRFVFRKLTWWWLISRITLITTLGIGGYNIPWIDLTEWILSLI